MSRTRSSRTLAVVAAVVGVTLALGATSASAAPTIKDGGSKGGTLHGGTLHGGTLHTGSLDGSAVLGGTLH